MDQGYGSDLNLPEADMLSLIQAILLARLVGFRLSLQHTPELASWARKSNLFARGFLQ